ncbi:CNP1-like family protein [Rhodoferax sp. UBA5149]|uniref:CNP1-like family protein n=1 Tax=Rhodoferax sp. UBA5149 TaxID=1947379 RepID=UPI0025EB9C5F|nr:CNP1-like family protein [Rhodoferax sp. UBA5149]
MKLDKLFWLGLTLVALNASAQIVTDPDWKETEAPPPPAFNRSRLIPIEMPPYVSLKFGVDPATMTITRDGIVRYVVVAVNATGSVTAMYEGIRCATGDVKTYARYAANGQWSSVKDPQWQGLGDNLPSRHAMALARQGVCEGRSAAASSVAEIVNALKYPKREP